MTGPNDTGDRPDCCTEENLVEQPTGREDLTVRVCNECGRRHFEVHVEPYEIRTEAF